jgi:UDP-glucose 4-epimerase
MNELATRVIKLADSSSKVEHISYEAAYGRPFDDLTRRVPRLDRIREAIGFNPKFDTDQIIKSVIQHQRRNSRKS